MGKFLHKLGEYAYKHKWWFVVGWIVVFAVVGFGAAVNYKPTTSSVSIPGTQAQQTLNRMNELFPDMGKGSGQIAIESTGDKKITDHKDQIAILLEKVSNINGVSRVVSPFENDKAISSDGKIAYAQVLLKDGAGSISKTTTLDIEKAVNESRTNGLTVEVGGDIINHMPSDLIGVGEIGGLLFALFILVVALSSLVAAGLPIIVALATVFISMAGLFSLSKLIDINQTTPVLAIMLGLAVGIDYSLFIVNKYKSLLLTGMSEKQAVGRAIGTAGNAVIFAASTVVIALASLSIVNIPFMTTMGLTGAATIAMAGLIAVTLIPAMLGIVGDKLFSRKTRSLIKKASKKRSVKTEDTNRSKIWFKWGNAIAKHPVIWLLVAIVFAGVIALPVQKLELGLPSDQYASSGSTERKAYEIMKRGFGEGFSGPLAVVVEGLQATTQSDKDAVRSEIMNEYNSKVQAATALFEQYYSQKAASISTPEEYAALQQEIEAVQAEGVQKQAAALAEIDEKVEKYAKLRQLSLIASEIAKVENVAQALSAVTTDDGTKGMIQVIPKASPSDKKTIDLISYLRNSENQKKITGGSGVTFGVTGSTALRIDIDEKLSNALPVYLATVIGLSLAILIIAFRSVLVPIKATLGFLLSVGAMFGSMVAVFQLGWFGIAEAPGPIVSFIPIIGIGILFGLAMDYEFFLVSSMHESYMHHKDAKKAVIFGFGVASKVVTAAFVIMVSVFAGFVMNDDSTVQAISFGLAIGVLVDALLVRMTIVPAVMTLLGKSSWWLPGWLDKLLPHVSIEGEDEK